MKNKLRKIIPLLVFIFSIVLFSGDSLAANEQVNIAPGSNIRNVSDGQVYLNMNIPLNVEGEFRENNFYFTYNGRDLFVNKSLVNYIDYSGHDAYVKSDANARDPQTNQIIKVIEKGTKISGYFLDGHIYVHDYDLWREVKIHQSLLSDDSIVESGYIAGNANIRSKDMDVIHTTKMPVYAELISKDKDYYIIVDSDLDVLLYNHNLPVVHKSLVSKSSPTFYGIMNGYGYFTTKDFRNNSQTNLRYLYDIARVTLDKDIARVVIDGKTYFAEPYYIRQDEGVYISAGSNIRSAKTRNVVSTTAFPIYAEGRFIGENYHFSYKGQSVYVHYSLVSLSYDGEYFKAYLSSAANVRRDDNDQIAYVLGKGETVEGYLYENKFSFYDQDKGEFYYIHQSLLTDTRDKYNGYLSANTNIRWMENDVMLRVGNKGEYIQGEVSGNKIAFNYQGIEAYVYRSTLQNSATSYFGYTKGRTNARSSAGGSVVSVIPKDVRLSGTFSGNYLRTTYSGRTVYVHKDMLATRRSTDYVVPTDTFTTALGNSYTGIPLTQGELDRFVTLINNHRRNNGAKPIVIAEGLANGSYIRSADLFDSFSHTRPDGSDLSTAFKPLDVSLGENIALGYFNVDHVFEGWRTSPGHNANMLNEGYDIFYLSGFSRSWVTVFD